MREPPVIVPRGAEPPFRQVAAWLQDEIESGRLQPGDVIPSEKELRDMTGTGRNTVRRAIALLREEEYIYTIAHRGSYVARR